MDLHQATEGWIEAVSAVDRYVLRAIAGDIPNPDELHDLRAALEVARQHCEDAAMREAGFNWEIALAAHRAQRPREATSANGSQYLPSLAKSYGESAPQVTGSPHGSSN